MLEATTSHAPAQKLVRLVILVAALTLAGCGSQATPQLHTHSGFGGGPGPAPQSVTK